MNPYKEPVEEWLKIDEIIRFRKHIYYSKKYGNYEKLEQEIDQDKLNILINKQKSIEKIISDQMDKDGIESIKIGK